MARTYFGPKRLAPSKWAKEALAVTAFGSEIVSFWALSALWLAAGWVGNMKKAKVELKQWGQYYTINFGSNFGSY